MFHTLLHKNSTTNLAAKQTNKKTHLLSHTASVGQKFGYDLTWSSAMLQRWCWSGLCAHLKVELGKELLPTSCGLLAAFSCMQAFRLRAWASDCLLAKGCHKFLVKNQIIAWQCDSPQPARERA